VLACERSGRQRQKQRSEPDRAYGRSGKPASFLKLRVGDAKKLRSSNGGVLSCYPKRYPDSSSTVIVGSDYAYKSLI
jgi:hypothetical protein